MGGKLLKKAIITVIGVCMLMTTSCNKQKEIQLPKENPCFSNIYSEGEQTADDKILTALDQCAATMRQNVLDAQNNYKVANGATVYYFSEKGSSQNDGLSPQTPKKDLYDLNYQIKLKPGDVVLFERGSTFRGQIIAKSNITYSAYGEGAKPIICGSAQNYAQKELWEQTEHKNIYVCTQKIYNAGNIVFDNTEKLGDYTQILGKLKVLELDNFSGVQDLKNDLEFHCDLTKNKLYLYSTQGNPGERFNTIEICEQGHIIDVNNVSNVTIDNLHLTLGGTHGVGAVNAKNLTVRSCVFNWIGGSVQYGTTRYGNAVESYVGSDGFYVYNNWIYQIYDTGITTQFDVEPNSKKNVMKNNEYYNNIIEYCFWSFEYFHRISEGVERITQNIYVHDNYCRMGGKGWGREGAGHMCCFATTGEKIENVIIEHNIFDRGHAFLVSAYDADASEIKYNENVYVQEKGELLAYIKSTTHYMDNKMQEVITNLVGDKKACVICVE